MRRRYLMLCQADYRVQFAKGFINAETQRDLERITRDAIDFVSRNMDSSAIPGKLRHVGGCLWLQLYRYS